VRAASTGRRGERSGLRMGWQPTTWCPSGLGRTARCGLGRGERI
jgi:hypothetical protein